MGQPKKHDNQKASAAHGKIGHPTSGTTDKTWYQHPAVIAAIGGAFIVGVFGIAQLFISYVLEDDEVSMWVISDSDNSVDVADIDIEVIYKVCYLSGKDKKVDVTTVTTGRTPIKKPVPLGSCVDVRIKPDQALKIFGPPNASGTYALVRFVNSP